MKKIFTSIIFLALTPSLLIAANKNRPLLREYQVEGIAILKRQNPDKAREEAIADAFENAVRLATSVMLQREPSPRKRAKIEEDIIKESLSYVQGYRIRNETFGAKYCSINISVTLFQGLLNQGLSDLGFKPETSVSPLVVVLVEEKIFPAYNRDNFMSLFSISEDSIVRDLNNSSWNAIGRKGIRGIRNERKIGRGIDGNIRAIVSLGEEFNAAVVVVGTASIDSGSNGRSHLMLTVVSVAGGRVLGEEVFTGHSNSKDALLAKTGALKNASISGGRFVSEILKRETGFSNRENLQPIAIPTQGR